MVICRKYGNEKIVLVTAALIRSDMFLPTVAGREAVVAGDGTAVISADTNN